MNAKPLMIAAGFCALGSPVQAEGKPAPPNVLLFISDDESWLERSAYGWSMLPAPAFDRVAKQGALFTNGYTSAPSCAPSRASVLTGRHFWELKQGAFIQAFIPKKFPIVTRILADHGHQVGRTGNVDGQGRPLANEALTKPSKIGFYDLKEDPWQLKDLADERKRLADKLRKVRLESGDPRVTGEMNLFRTTRQYVQKRKPMGYTKSGSLPLVQ